MVPRVSRPRRIAAVKLAGVAAATTAVQAPASAGPARPRRDRAVTLAAVYYLLAALAVTLWLWRDPASRTVAGNANDADQFAWFFRYDATAVMHLRLPALVTTAMNAPQGVNVMWNTFMLLPGVLLAPVTVLLGPQTALTVFMTAGFAGSATAMFAVLRRWGVTSASAALGGAVYGFSPAVLHSAIGHYDLMFAVLPPLIIDVTLRLVLGRVTPVRGGLWLGLLVTAQLLITEEILLGTAVAGVILLLVLAASRPRAVAAVPVRRVAAGLGLAACVTGVIAGYPLWVQFFGPLHQHGSPFTPDFFKDDLSSFVVPSSYLLFHTAGSAVRGVELPGSPARVPRLPGLAAARRAGAGHDRLLAAATGPGGRGHLRGARAVLARRHAAVRRARAPRDQAAVVLAAGPAVADRGAARPVLPAGGRRGRRRARPGRRRGAGRPWRRSAHRRRWPRLASGWRPAAVVMSCAVLAVLPIVPRPLPAAAVNPPPPGWSATFAALRLPASASVLVVPLPMSTFTEPLRWQADTGEPSAMVGGYFMGPAAAGRGYIDGYGTPPAGLYLNAMWLKSAQDLPAALASGVPGRDVPASESFTSVKAVTDARCAPSSRPGG